MTIKNRYKEVKDTCKKHLVLWIGIVIAYVGLNIWVNQVYVIGLSFFTSYTPLFVITFTIVNLLVAILVGANLVMSMKRIKMYKQAAVGSASIGMFAGLLGGACPGCFAGLFPAVASLFGVTASLSSLPLYGIEIGLLSILILVGTLYWISGPMTCGTIKR